MNCQFKLNHYNQQTCNDAISKLHGSGSAVPKKVTGKYIYTLDAIAAAKNRIYGNKILIIADYDSQNDVKLLLSQIQDLAFGKDATFDAFRTTVGYDTTLINLKKNVDSVSAAKSAGAADIYEDVDGQILITYISQIVKDVNTNPTGYSYYDGADLTVDNYTLVIMFTKLLPFHDITNAYETKYPAFYDHIVDVNEYVPQLGYNLQSYINSGGNVILGNNIWQTLTNAGGIPNFSYSGIPFVQKTYYQYADSNYAVNEINILIEHPILKKCGSNLSLQPPNYTQSVIKNIISNPDATVLATIADSKLAGVPFLAINVNNNGGRIVAINSYLGTVSTNNLNGNREFAKIIFNAIYWCFKINN
jgi:hypothetical protein